MMHDIHCSGCLDNNILPWNEINGFSNEDWYFGRTIWSASNTIQNIVWVKNISLKDIMLRDIGQV